LPFKIKQKYRKSGSFVIIGDNIILEAQKIPPAPFYPPAGGRGKYKGDLK